jgi:hypothetical protein
MNIKKGIPSVLYAIGIYVFSVNAFAAIPGISFAMDDNTIQVNEAFKIKVLVNEVVSPDEVLAFGFDTIYDGTWNLDAITIGPDFDDTSGAFIDTQVSGLAFPSGPNGSNILLATLQFTASQAGDFDFGIFSDLSDPNEGLFLLDEADAIDLSHSQSVAITAIPLPAANLLFSFGLLGIGLLRNKIKWV